MTPQLLKPAVTKALNELLAPIQQAFQASEEWKQVTERAYPPVEDDKKKKKKQPKDKGSRYPGGGKGPAAQDGAAKEAELPVRPAEGQ